MVRQLFDIDQCIFIEYHTENIEATIMRFLLSAAGLYSEIKVLEAHTRYEMNLSNI
jgi:hypothetical protein